MADNDENKKENLKFLHEFHCFHQEFDDGCVPQELREAVWNAECELNMEELTVFKEGPTIQWVPSRHHIVIRDNDNRRVRELFCEKDCFWRPLFGYKEREKLAMECCKCNECRFLTKKRLRREEGLPDMTRSDFDRHYAQKGDGGSKCTKTSFYLPYVEREDDEGDYPSDDYCTNVTVPALEEGMQALEEGMQAMEEDKQEDLKKRARQDR